MTKQITIGSNKAPTKKQKQKTNKKKTALAKRFSSYVSEVLC